MHDVHAGVIWPGSIRSALCYVILPYVLNRSLQNIRSRSANPHFMFYRYWPSACTRLTSGRLVFSAYTSGSQRGVSGIVRSPTCTQYRLVLFSVKGSMKLWTLVSIFSEWFTEM